MLQTRRLGVTSWPISRIVWSRERSGKFRASLLVCLIILVTILCMSYWLNYCIRAKASLLVCIRFRVILDIDWIVRMLLEEVLRTSISPSISSLNEVSKPTRPCLVFMETGSNPVGDIEGARPKDVNITKVIQWSTFICLFIFLDFTWNESIRAIHYSDQKRNERSQLDHSRECTSLRSSPASHLSTVWWTETERVIPFVAHLRFWSDVAKGYTSAVSQILALSIARYVLLLRKLQLKTTGIEMKFKQITGTASDESPDLPFLHSVLEERGKYVPLGWSKPVEYSVSDLKLAQMYTQVR